MFQMTFAIITPALITGAFAERKRFKAFVIFSMLCASLARDAEAICASADSLKLRPWRNMPMTMPKKRESSGTVIGSFVVGEALMGGSMDRDAAGTQRGRGARECRQRG